MMRALFFYVSATSVLKERKKERKKKGCAYKKIITSLYNSTYRFVFQHAKNEQAALNRAA